MSSFADMIGPMILIVGFGIVALILTIWNRLRVIAARETLNKFDYVVFEAERSELVLLQSDLARIGWSLSKTSPTDSAAMHYRFERTSYNATKLGDISLDYDKHMPMTSGRKSEIIIKIKDHGLRR